MRTGNQTWDALLGALVGVVRAEQKNAKTVETDRVLFEGFAALAEDDETALQNMLACAHAEKNRIAPDCAYCAMPCGSTSDLDSALCATRGKLCGSRNLPSPNG